MKFFSFFPQEKNLVTKITTLIENLYLSTYINIMCVRAPTRYSFFSQAGTRYFSLSQCNDHHDKSTFNEVFISLTTCFLQNLSFIFQILSLVIWLASQLTKLMKPKLARHSKMSPLVLVKKAANGTMPDQDCRTKFWPERPSLRFFPFATFSPD